MRGQHRELAGILVTLAIGTALFGAGSIGQSVQAEPQKSGTASADDLQRSYRIDRDWVVADSGPARGENIYFYKCWMCHNQYYIAANPEAATPYLQDLFKHANLRSGGPVNDETVAKHIKDGSGGMPAFRTTLTDADVADVVSYLKSGKCCLEGENPPANPWYRAETNKWPVQTSLSGGARGVVRSSTGGGDSPEGIKVQLIAPNAVRTTVYTNEQGYYEFPKMQAGTYTLRIATPVEFKPYRRDAVRIDGATKLDDIVLERNTLPGTDLALSDSEALAPTPENEAQLSGAELFFNLPGTGQEKDVFRRGCGGGCHSYQTIFRNRYDEHSWSVIVDRMFNFGGADLVHRTPVLVTPGRLGRGTKENQQMIVKWLAKVRGPEAQDGPLHYFPRPLGDSTRLVVTEYELPRQLLGVHDVSGDSKGNIWYCDYQTAYFGKLDPRTGVVTEYRIPDTPGIMTGTHAIIVDQKHGDLVWISEAWNGKLTKMDPRTGEFTRYDGAAGGNFAVAPDGSVWSTRSEAAVKVDPQTGKIVAKYPIPGRTAYGNAVSDDGHFWAGGSPQLGGNYASLLDIWTGKMNLLDMGNRLPGPSRGGFDPSGNAWFGGRSGSLLEIDTKAMKMREYFVPTGNSPYMDFYEAMPDKNGEVWAGLLHGRGFVRYNPRTDRWVEYAMPEPYGHNRKTWIDNSTNPVTVWYVDYEGYIVRIQPLK